MDSTRSASAELAALQQRQADLAGRVDQVTAEQRAAAEAAAAASAELVALEKAALSGERVSARRRMEAEERLAAARRHAEQPWQERRAAAREAVRDAEAAVRKFTAEHAEALLADLAAEGEQAAQAMDAAAQAVVDANAWRASVEQRTFALITLIRPARPGDVARSRAEALAAEAGKVLAQGGERAPQVLVPPTEPRHGEVSTAVPA
jgi:hypothetical protein